MYPTFLREAQVIKQVLKDFPSLVITMPFEPRLTPKKVLEREADNIFNKAKMSLLSDPFSGDPAPVIHRVNKQLASLNYQSVRKSIAVFATRSMDKIFYTDMPLEVSININGSFYMRDLIHHKVKVKEYLVLVVNKHWANTFTGNSHGLRLLKIDSPAHLVRPETRKFPGNKKYHEPAKTFLEMIANQFNWVTATFPRPVFMLGNREEVNTVYEKINDRKNVVQHVHRDTDAMDTRKITRSLKPFLQDWETLWQTYLMQQLEDARMHRRLVAGLRDVTVALKTSSRGLLLVDENMHVPFKHEHDEEASAEPIYINDRIDKLIESAIECCVDIEFVKPELLQEDNGIAFIRSATPVRIPDVREERDKSWLEIF